MGSESELGPKGTIVAACPEIKGVLTPTSQESQDEVMSVWSVCRVLKIPQFKDHSYVLSKR